MMAGLIALLAALTGAQEWHTLHGDAQRSGHSARVVEGPYERKWYRDFHDEMIATRVEAIVAEGKCFVGTFAGTLHALDVKDGSTVWTFKAAGAIGHSPAYSNGLLYVGADDGKVRALSASDGTLRWTYDAGAGVWVSPLVTPDGLVCFGDRAGVFHAVRAKTGRRAWTFRTGGPILKPASLSPSGTILFASDDMHAIALSPEGRQVWRSAKMQGVTTRDQAPTIWKGLAIFRTSPADGFHEVMNRNQEILAAAQKRIPLGAKDKMINDKHGAYILRFNPKRVAPEQDAVVDYLKKNPWDRTFYAFDVETGREPWIAPVFYLGGLHNPATAPTFDPETGELYTFTRTCVTNYSRGVRPFTGVGRLQRDTGRIENLPHAHGDTPGWTAFATIGDETESLSLMGHVLLSTHQGTIGGLDLRTRKWHPIYNGRDTYGGIFGPAAVPGMWEGAKKYSRQGYLVSMPNEWHGPDRSILAVAENRLFWVVGSQVVCWGGPDTPRMKSGGLKPPPPVMKRFKRVYVGGGNVTTGKVGGRSDIKKAELSVDDVRPILDAPAIRSGNNDRIRSRLEAAVKELVSEESWAPFIVELGISGEERHFWRTSETLQIVSLALPHLDPETRRPAVAFLDRLFKNGALTHAPDGKRRELYDLGPGMKEFAAQTPDRTLTLDDLYGWWAYAHYADRWDAVLEALGDARRLLQAPASESARDLNARFAGALGYARLMAKAGRKPEVDRALELLAKLATERAHHERADMNFVRKPARRALHTATIPRYVDLTPELCALLRRHAGEAFHDNVRGLTRQLPVWYQAFGERMIGGENYTHTPELARGLFAALADGLRAAPEELASRLDQPWCRGDLYLIEKLTAILRR